MGNNLQNELTHYGLNPDEWILTDIKENCILIENIFDHSFKLIGFTKLKNKKRESWKKIELLAV